MNSLPGSGQVDAIYVDLAKAFDRVDQDILLDKLKAFGVCGKLLQWLVSYLTDRSQCVRLVGSCSRTFDVASGVLEAVT